MVLVLVVEHQVVVLLHMFFIASLNLLIIHFLYFWTDRYSI